MSVAQRIYGHTPGLVQDGLASLYGLRQRRLRYGGRYQTYLEELQKAQWWDTPRLMEEQDNRLRGLMEFCNEHVPYYQRICREAGVSAPNIRTADDLKALPMLDKETVRAHMEDFAPENYRERLIPQTTGGTTGTPLRYFATADAIRFNYAAYEARYRHWAGVAFGQRTATFLGRPIVPAKSTKPPFWRRNIAFNQLYFSAYHLNAAHLPAYMERLRRFDPVVIVGYVSTVHAVARYILEHDHIGAVKPKAVLLSSETLFDWIRKDIETAFSCRAWDGYSLGELVAFISECPEGSMHVSPEYGVIEFVPTEGGHELVCTGLFNYGMPLIRYRTGDIAEPGDGRECSCGRGLPIVRSLTGRVDDAVVTPEGARIGPAPMSLAFQSIPNLRSAQIHQSSERSIAVWIETTDAFSTDNEAQLLADLRNRLGVTIEITFERVDSMPRTAAGKQRLIVSNLGR